MVLEASPATTHRSTRKRLSYFAVCLLVASLVAAGGSIYALRRVEFAITFHPSHDDLDGKKTPRNAEDVWFTASDGTRLHGWWYRSPNTPAKATIIYFHGNTGNISYVDWVAQSLVQQRFNVLLFDYRGYGKSDGELLDERGLYKDGDAALKFVLTERAERPEHVVLYGQSLGTAVATDVASRQSCGALILESGMSSASAIASNVLPWLPRWLHFLGRNRLDSARKLPLVSCPVLITHGERDGLIPVDQARTLFAAAHEPKKLLIFHVAGHNVFGDGGEPYLSTLASFIRSSLKNRQ